MTEPDPHAVVLTARQCQVFETYQREGSYQAAADALGLGHGTIKNTLRAVYDALGANSAVQASARYADYKEAHRASQ